MKNKAASLALLGLGSLVLVAIGFASSTKDRDGFRVLAVTDSIGIGWSEHLGNLVEPELTFYRSPKNARDTASTLGWIDEWLSETRPDVIIWNNGIHDSSLVNGGTRRMIQPEAYRHNLGEIAERMVSSGARVYFLSTTPVDAWNKQTRDPHAIPQYNAIAREVMAEKGVSVIDLNGFVRAMGIERPVDGVHYDSRGYYRMAVWIAERTGLAIL